MAAGLPQSRCGLFQHLLFSLWALQSGLRNSVSGVKVTQHPPLANKPQGEIVELSCNVDQDNYQFYWYHQRPGHTNLKQLGILKPFVISEGDTLEEKPGGEIDSRLSGKRGGRTAKLTLRGLELNDTGLYLCASNRGEQAYFADTGTQLIVKDETCQSSQPTVHLLGPVCHKDYVTLVCVAQGFPYAWPIDVSWKRDGQEVTLFSVATDPVRTLDSAPCNFGVSSRLTMTAAAWQERHVYSCHVRQGNIAEAEESMEREPSQQSASTVLEFQSSLHTGQIIFLLLVVKSFAYGTALGIYTACKKKTGL